MCHLCLNLLGLLSLDLVVSLLTCIHYCVCKRVVEEMVYAAMSECSCGTCVDLSVSAILSACVHCVLVYVCSLVWCVQF